MNLNEEDPVETIRQLTDAITAYEEFDQRKPGWIKVVLEPSA